MTNFFCDNLARYLRRTAAAQSGRQGTGLPAARTGKLLKSVCQQQLGVPQLSDIDRLAACNRLDACADFVPKMKGVRGDESSGRETDFYRRMARAST